MKNSTYVVRKLLFVSLSFLFTFHITQAQLVPKGLTAPNGRFIGFYEYKPTNYNTNTKYPVIIFLHGIGERGNGTTDLARVLGNGTPSNINTYGHNMSFTWNGKTETFLVLCPQLSDQYGSWQNFYVDEMIKYATNNLSIDTNRIFLTGLSLGGGGVWKFAAGSLDNAKKLAAIGVTCGTCENVDFGNIARANLPTWAWHANDDGTVSPGCSNGAVQTINQNNPNVKPYLTIWPTGQHWIWGRVYDTGYWAQNPNIYEWFLGQDKSKPINRRPIANAGPNISITTGLGAVSLNASASSDPDGRIVRYVWTQLSGPTTSTLPNGGILTNAIASITGLLIAGTYTFELRVIDDRADWSSTTVTVSVSLGPAPGNQRPTANAGQDITITLPDNSATLNGSGSNDPDGTISYNWSYVNGPTQYTLNNSNSANASLSNLAEGSYTFKLTVTDNGGLSHEDQVTVRVNAPVPPPNQAPVANAGNDITIDLPSTTTTLDGSGSRDPDGNIASYAWGYISGPTQYTFANPNAATTELSNLAEGSYTFRLVVTDNGGVTHEDRVNVTVNPDPNAPPPANRPPRANAGNNIVLTLPSNSTTLNASASSDPDNNLASYAWSYISGPNQYTFADAAASSTGLSDLLEGTYNFRLVVTDSEGLTDSDTIVVVVNPVPAPGNVPPIPVAGGDITITLPTNSVTLDGSLSSDPDGNLNGYEWMKLTGPSQYNIVNMNGTTTTVNNLVQGSYTFKLRVWDNLWVPRDDTLRITVNPEPNVAPVANAGADITITLPTNSLTLNGTGSTDHNNNITGYQWTRIAGPNQHTLANGNAASTELSNLVEGNYSFRLVVSDAGGLSDSDTVNVTVNPAPNQRPVANAGNNISITLPTSNTTLYGSASGDIDGSITNYEWTRIAGPTQHALADATSATTALSGLVQGIYSFRLVVTDNGGLTDSDTVQVTVNAAPPPPPNQKPTAHAGNNVTINAPTSHTTLIGTNSYDSDGTIKNFLWSNITGPNQAAITSPSNGATAVTNLVPGIYTFRLLVTDNGGLTDDDTVQVTVNAAPPPANRLPIANAGSDFNVNLPNPTIALNGSTSYDPDGTISSYRWTKITGPGAITITNSTTDRPNVVGVHEGVYTFELTVTDNRGDTAKDQVRVTVRGSSNLPPVANAGRDTGIAVPATSAILDGRASYDPDGVIVNYTWKQVSGPTVSVLANLDGSVTVVNELETGDYIFELTVTDNNGASSKDSVRVLVVNNFRYVERLLVYPNPVPTSTLNVRVISDSLGTTRMTIYDMNGRALKHYSTVKNQSFFEMPIGISMLKKGVYWLEINIDNKKRMITKFIKR